jgi:hypothetical protein
MQHTFETDKTFETYACNMCVKHMQHSEKIITTLKKHLLQHKIETTKNLEHTVATYV